MNNTTQGIKRVLLMGSNLKIRRGLASALNRCLDKPGFTAVDTSKALPDPGFGWDRFDLMLVDISVDKPRIMDWYCKYPDKQALPPVIFTDRLATVDDAGDLYRAGATDYIDLRKVKRSRLMRALELVKQVLLERKSGYLPSPGLYDRVEEKTELLETVSAESRPRTQGAGGIVTQAKSPVDVTKRQNETTEDRADFLNTGLLSILDRGKVKETVHSAISLSEGRSDESWPFTYRDIDEGIAVFSGYRVLKYLGSGGTASVFKVEREADGKTFAMKMFDVETADMHGKDRFKRGYELLKDIHHQHIGQIETFIDTGVHLAAILEYFPNGDLQSRIEGHAHIPRDKAIYYAIQIASGLNAAQDHGVLHRDLKPSNVMFREDSDSLALIDFGIAKSVKPEQGHHLTMEGQLVGTPYYTSPEQALGKIVDHRSDLYALGVILYEMLEGKKPYDGNSAIEIMTGHVRGDIPEISDTDEALKIVVRRLLAKSPEDRYISGLEVEHALQSLS